MGVTTRWLPYLLLPLLGCAGGGAGLDADLKLLPANCQAVGTVKVGDILNSQAYKDFAAEEYKAFKLDFATEFEAHTGLALAEISTATFGINEAGDFAVVLTMSKPLTAAEIIKNQKHRAQFMVSGLIKAPPPRDEPRKYKEVKIGSYTIQESEEKSDNFTFCVVNPTTVLIGEPKALQKILTRNKKPEVCEGIQKAWGQGDKSRSVWLAVEVKNASKKMPAPRPENPSAGLQHCAGDVDAAVFEANFGQDSDCSLVLLCKDGATATKIKAEFDKLIARGKDKIAEFGPPDIPIVPIIKPLHQLLESSQVEASGSKLTVTAKGSPIVVALVAMSLLRPQAEEVPSQK